MLGSAPVARRWLLIEHPGPWAKNHLDTSPLAGPVAAAVEAGCAELQGRSLLVRRHGRRPPGEARAWYAVDTAHGTWVTGTWRTSEDLLTAVAAMGAPLSQSESLAEPMLLVCTHGTRDACCALRGRPITAALARVWPDEVWECTHLGGHRFSGTFLSMPDGTCFGGVDMAGAVEVVRSHRAGSVATKHLRGITRFSPAVQAAPGPHAPPGGAPGVPAGVAGAPRLGPRRARAGTGHRGPPRDRRRRLRAGHPGRGHR